MTRRQQSALLGLGVGVVLMAAGRSVVGGQASALGLKPAEALMLASLAAIVVAKLV